jgi:hypothetical protein
MAESLKFPGYRTDSCEDGSPGERTKGADTQRKHAVAGPFAGKMSDDWRRARMLRISRITTDLRSKRSDLRVETTEMELIPMTHPRQPTS